ncbi:uncharacterized protein LOC143031987 [Oratosquilla oratoria]|uniref:uncharacterized protein LOC143031987 n=1 Tax=Oratosquilla oratoria TaxID=337810 RepID=UPI003F76F219
MVKIYLATCETRQDLRLHTLCDNSRRHLGLDHNIGRMQVSLVITLALALCAVGYSHRPPQCKGRGMWLDKCNWCHCDYGHPVCTEIGCTKPYPERQCKGRVSWRERCNTCFCENGYPSCTEKYCGVRD